MWGSPKGITEADVEKRIAKGIGLNSGADYIPWIKKHDFGSKGTAKELFGIKIQRAHHLLSQLEYYVFLNFEFDRDVIDIREQFPLLDRDLVVRIAKEIGCRVPKYPKTRTVYVMTTDFLLTLKTPEGLKLVAIAVKPSSQLTQKRVCELLEIERRYWQKFGVDWSVVTERELNRNRWLNLRWLRQGAMQLSASQQAQEFLDSLHAEDWAGVSLLELLWKVAKKVGIRFEFSVALFKYSVWHGMVKVDLNRRLDLSQEVTWLNVTPTIERRNLCFN